MYSTDEYRTRDVYLQADDGRQSDKERNEEGGNRLFIYLLGGK
jgi:hypothetical protein